MRHTELAPRSPRNAEAGFTLAELVVSLLVLTVVLVAVLTLFDSSNKIAKAQVNVADMQQSIRVAQDEMIKLTRMASRGGLTRGDLPNDTALAKQGAGLISVSVRDNVTSGGAEQSIAIGDGASPLAMPGTDVLMVRGVFNTPLYQLNPAPGAAFTLDDPTNPTKGTVTLEDPQPTTGVHQDLSYAIEAVTQKRHEALVIGSALGSSLYGVVELDPDASDVTTDPKHIVLAFKISGGTYTDGYNKLDAAASTCSQPPAVNGTPCFPRDLRSAAQVGILEEYRYYIRQVLTDPANPASEAKPRLSRARVYPNSQAAWDGNRNNLAQDIADDIIDLQVALAIDTNGDNQIAPETGAGDEWLYNFAGSDQAATDTPAPTATAWNLDATGNTPKLFYVRVTTVARTAGRDFQFEPTRITKIEDHTYDTAAQDGQSQYRLRTMQTVIDLRNLG